MVAVAGCGGSAARPAAAKKFVALAPAPVPVCSLLTAHQVSGLFKLPVSVEPSRFSCTYGGTTSGGVYRAVVVTPQPLSAAPPVSFDPKSGTIVQLAGPGYRGQAQDDPPSGTAAGLAQAHAQVLSGQVNVRVFVTYKGSGLHGVSQLPEVATLANLVGRHLAR